ncbi:MAG: hypothetical protein ABII18_05030 [bacterium]|nr:hypothetical protein [bacterium]
MKKIIFISLILTLIISIPAFADNTEQELQDVSAKLCEVLVQTDKTGFENMLSADSKNQMQWWWEASGKGKYFATLYGSCKFDHIDAKSLTSADKKVFIQRFSKDGTPWSRPAPVVFIKDDSGSWKIKSYSL